MHLKRRILIRGNLLGYEKLSKVWKDMGLQKRIIEKEREPGRGSGYVAVEAWKIVGNNS